MQLLVIGKHPDKSKHSTESGFSLLELLIVLVIIGIIISVALLAFGDFGKTSKIRNAAAEFANLLPLVEEQAILEPNIYGLEINAQGYGFYQIIKQHGKQLWVAVNDDPLLRFRAWPAGTQIHLTVNSQSAVSIPNRPTIIINSSGNITAFTLKVSAQQPITLIQVFENGKVIQNHL